MCTARHCRRTIARALFKSPHTVAKGNSANRRGGRGASPINDSIHSVCIYAACDRARIILIQPQFLLIASDCRHARAVRVFVSVKTGK